MERKRSILSQAFILIEYNQNNTFFLFFLEDLPALDKHFMILWLDLTSNINIFNAKKPNILIAQYCDECKIHLYLVKMCVLMSDDSYFETRWNRVEKGKELLSVLKASIRSHRHAL